MINRYLLFFLIALLMINTITLSILGLKVNEHNKEVSRLKKTLFEDGLNFERILKWSKARDELKAQIDSGKIDGVFYEVSFSSIDFDNKTAVADSFSKDFIYEYWVLNNFIKYEPIKFEMKIDFSKSDVKKSTLCEQDFFRVADSHISKDGTLVITKAYLTSVSVNSACIHASIEGRE